MYLSLQKNEEKMIFSDIIVFQQAFSDMNPKSLIPNPDYEWLSFILKECRLHYDDNEDVCAGETHIILTGSRAVYLLTEGKYIPDSKRTDIDIVIASTYLKDFQGYESEANDHGFSFIENHPKFMHIEIIVSKKKKPMRCKIIGGVPVIPMETLCNFYNNGLDDPDRRGKKTEDEEKIRLLKGMMQEKENFEKTVLCKRSRS